MLLPFEAAHSLRSAEKNQSFSKLPLWFHSSLYILHYCDNASLIYLPYTVIIKVAGVRLPAHLVGCCSGRLWKGDRYFLCLHFAVPNDLGGCFSIFCIRFNQLCDVLKVLIELCGCHLVHFLTSFRKRCSPLPYNSIIVYG